MADASAEKKSLASRSKGLFKLAFGGAAGLATGVIGVYATAIVDKVAKPPKPLANFGCTCDGLTVTCNNLASGESGWWDFGDGTTLEAFDPTQKQVTHTYDQPGKYTVKLVVRNFLNEENDRAVGVDVAPASAKPGGGPQVANLTVEPIGNGTAPATFRIRGEVKNAQQYLFDTGDGGQSPELLPAGNGTFERLVVYEKADQYPLMVFAFGGGKAVKDYRTVQVKAPSAGALSVVAKVTDSGTRAELQTKPTTVPVQVPQKLAGTFERVILPDAGFTFTDVKLGTVTSKAVRGVKAELASDRKSVKVSGEWTGSVESVTRAAGGSDVMVPLTITQQRSTPFSTSPQMVASPLAFGGSFSLTSDDWASGNLVATLKLPAPPTGVTALQRKVSLDLHEMAVFAGRTQDRVVGSLPDVTKPTEEYAVALSNGERRVMRVERTANEVKVTIRPQTAGSRAGR
ncbi:MAG: PKD domain-containing protein [Fimbriiglobus sp.]|jgi:hypothetical protein|nr:PKD domain-containing protein [Fimbriiglobus sp.]